MANEQYYTIEEVAKMLKVAYLTVYRWIQAGKLIAYKAGKQYRIKKQDLDKFLKAAENNDDFVVGNRMQNPEGMPKIRVFTNKLMSWLISKITKQKIPDSQCGFRLIKRKVLEKLNIETNKFQIESEIIIKAARLGILIKSIPIRSIYYEKALSKIHPLLDTLRFIKFLFRLYKKKTDERK